VREHLVACERDTPTDVKLAIMQPYLFPYIGYFQLMHAVDRFVIADDLVFIKQGGSTAIDCSSTAAARTSPSR